MVGFKKSIEIYTKEPYRDLRYGVIYYIPGTETPVLNSFVKRNARRIAKLLNENKDYWISCKIIYLDKNNTFFVPRKEAAFYSAMLPTIDDVDKGYSFFVATLQNCATEQMCIAFAKYFETLLKMFDEILDTGKYRTSHLQFDEDLMLNDMVVIHLKEGELPISGLLQHKNEGVFCHHYLSRMEITPNTYQILLTDYNTELHFNTQVKALYVLFLLHPNGIRLKEISDYKDEYKKLYFLFTKRSDIEKLHESVERFFDACSPNIFVKKSQCNEELKRVIPEDDIRKYYEIEVNRGHPHRILLDRDLVKMPDTLLLQKHL